MIKLFSLLLTLVLTLSACSLSSGPLTRLPGAATDSTGDMEVAHAPDLAGLVLTYGDGIGLARFDESGRLTQLSMRPGAALSPDGEQELYPEGFELWLEPVGGSAAVRNLTQSSERLETACQWWAARPGWIVLAYLPAKNPGAAASLMGLLQAESGEFIPLQAEIQPAATPALSPDGRTIAYNLNAMPYLLDVESGVGQPIPLESIASHLGRTFLMVVFPTWAPDGASLAWKLYDQAGWIGTATYSPLTGEWTLLNEYIAVMSQEPYAQLAFSPDGRWLVLANQNDPALPGRAPAMWVLPLSGAALDASREAVLLGAGVRPVWSPDSSSLVFTQPPPQGGGVEQDKLVLVQVGSWEALDLGDLPGGYYAVEWR
jgi:hypothetical protein